MAPCDHVPVLSGPGCAWHARATLSHLYRSIGHAGAALQFYSYPGTMPLRLPQLSLTITCEGNELELFDVKQEGPSLVTAFVASEAGKVRRFASEKPADK